MSLSESESGCDVFPFSNADSCLCLSYICSQDWPARAFTRTHPLAPRTDGADGQRCADPPGIGAIAFASGACGAARGARVFA